MRHLLVLPLLVLGACAPEAADAPDLDAESALIGGADARSHPAVGALVTGDGARRRAFCTATLVAPRVVVTAKHCTEGLPADAAFALGRDARAPERVVAVERFERAAPHTGGWVRRGSDVAGIVLAEAVTDVTPVPITALALRPLDLGQRLVAVGYGAQGTAAARDTQKSGELTLLAVEGAPLPTRYASVSRWLDAAADHYDQELGTFQIEDLTLRYERRLLAGYEAYLSDTSVQTCHGDSGGPILRRTSRGFEVAAVVSTGPLPATLSRPGLCAGGNIVAVVGAPAREMLTSLADATR